MTGGSGRGSGGGGREPGCSTRGNTERRGGGGGGTGRVAGGAGGMPARTGGGGTDGEGAPDREGIGSGATGARRGGADAPFGPEALERRGGWGLPDLDESSDMSDCVYATNQSQTRKALWCRLEQKQIRSRRVQRVEAMSAINRPRGLRTSR